VSFKKFKKKKNKIEFKTLNFNTTKKWGVFDVSNPPSKKPRQNFLTWQKLKRQKS
jgi:hypothetical protein